MRNPWLDIPLQDYEGHMSLPSVGQAQMLANQLGLLIERHAPRSAAIIGCAGGNGIDRIGPGQLERLVALDINPAYVEAVGTRYANRVPGLELCRADVGQDAISPSPYERLQSPRLALRRIAARVRQGGHDVPRADVLRRLVRGWENFQQVYRPLADEWAIYDNSGDSPRLLERWP